MQYWKKLTHAEMDTRITAALKENINYINKTSLGIPASKLDGNVFYDQASFLKEAPLLRTYVQNPNHIGCHTLGDSEAFFSGTQELERETIALLATDLLGAAPDDCDGYIASGGTEANIQAAWIYRNYFMTEHQAGIHEIALISSADTHYSVAKASNLLNIAWYPVPVDFDSREIKTDALDVVIRQAKAEGKKYFIIIANMATTMFGSVDDPDVYVSVMERHQLTFRLHVDGAFGGFIYPVSEPENNLCFRNPHVSSVTLDAHKMLQAPYGTGVFIIRKGLMHYVYTREAQYVSGMDITLSGSRSGANAIAVWMILFTYGPFGWLEKINKLLYRTEWCCRKLGSKGIPFYRHPKMNIITIRASHIPLALVDKYGLVPDTHEGEPQWYKIVVMDHVEIDHLESFLGEI